MNISNRIKQLRTEKKLVKDMLNLIVMKHKFQNLALSQPDSIL